MNNSRCILAYVFVMFAAPKKDVKIKLLLKGRFFVGWDVCTLPVSLHISSLLSAL